MIHAQNSRFTCINAATENGIPDLSQTMRDHRNLQAVFLDIFALGIPHQPPTLNKLHTR
ncbi:hypothetical protein SDC9_146288 [bioreactor metagenome]|uniref:Uncharacterized protein n=1 Tax=bioreactor metagenome TaxID=1076179 RepID=A0A645EDC3_9ZZZZ